MGFRALVSTLCSSVFLISGMAVAVPVSIAQPVMTKAPQVLLIDNRSGSVLLSHDADKQIPPASLAKLMTAEVVFEALKNGQVTLETPYFVSEHAWRTGGAPSGTSTMFAKIKSMPTVADLLQGMIVQAANDGAIILAEGLAGSEKAFVERMNKRAEELGMTHSKFVNSTGLPAEGQTVSLNDLLRLARHIYTDHPEFYKYYSQSEFKWNNILQRNRNPLLRLEMGADGFATGYTQASGYALVASAEQNGRRLFLAMSGLESIKDREAEAKKLVEWGMNSFDEMMLFKANEVVGDAKVFGGTQGSVPLKVKDDVEILLQKGDQTKLKAQISYTGPLQAPIKQDSKIGELTFMRDGNMLKQVPVYASQSVEIGSLSDRALGAVYELSTGWLRNYL